MNNLMETYRRLPVAFACGTGTYLQDADGKQYLDAYLVESSSRPQQWTWFVRVGGYQVQVCPPPRGDGTESPCSFHDTAWLLKFDAASGEHLGSQTTPDRVSQ